MTIAAIPTVYNGIQFRSRLEARWAAFFNLCGWIWDYEPLDLNGWIPDFRLGRSLFDVKPSSDDIAATISKITNACPVRDTWATHAGPNSLGVITESPSRIPLLPFARQIGFLGSDRTSFHPLVVFTSQESGGRPTIKYASLSDTSISMVDWYGHWNGSPREPFATRRSLDFPVREVVFDDGAHIDALWAQASNVTQWKGEKNRG